MMLALFSSFIFTSHLGIKILYRKPNLIKGVGRQMSEFIGSGRRQSIQMANVGTDAGKLSSRLGLDGQKETKQLLIGG